MKVFDLCQGKLFFSYPLVKIMALLLSGTHLALNIFAIPFQITLVAVFLEARQADAVVLSGIDHKLRCSAQPAEGLVELLRVEDWDIPVLFSTHDQRRRYDFLHRVERREALP